MNLDRRSFLALGTASVLTGCRMFTGSNEDYDDSLSVFLSDVHISPKNYTVDMLSETVAEILAMDPLPRRVVVFGDIAYLYGRGEDYAVAEPIIRLLSEAGIEVTLGLGNHDRRGRFLDHWPEYSKRTMLPGRIVTETSLGSCDLVMLDTLWENHSDETKMCKVAGQLNGDEWEWLKAELPRRKRPFFLAAHHPVYEIKDGDWKAVNDAALSTPNFIGWINGHDHAFKHGLLGPSKRKWGDNFFRRWLCLPSTGLWGDIGYVKFRTSQGAARADLVMKDRYFPRKDKKTEIDADILLEKRNAFISFRWKA